MNAGTFVTVTVVVSSAAAWVDGWVHGEGDTTARKGEGKDAQNSPMEDAKRAAVTRGCWEWRSSVCVGRSALTGFSLIGLPQTAMA